MFYNDNNIKCVLDTSLYCKSSVTDVTHYSIYNENKAENIKLLKKLSKKKQK